MKARKIFADSEVGKYKLYYFKLKGRGQAIRYIFVENGIDYEEVDTGLKDWETEWLAKFKPMMAFGQVPMLQDGDFEIVQSCAILRYLGRKHDLSTVDPKDGAKVDTVNDHGEEIRLEYVNLIYGDNFAVDKEKFVAGLPAKLQPLENLFTKWGSDYITDKMTWADYNLFDLLDILLVMSPSCLDAYPKLQAYFQRIASRPKLQEYRRSEAFINLPINANDNQ